jgi:hypothetical protein
MRVTQANDQLTKEIEDLKGVEGPPGGPGRPGLDGEPGVYTIDPRNVVVWASLLSIPTMFA